MPFTPYHMGPAFPAKAAGGRGFSLLLYGYTQVLIDVEALYRIATEQQELHGYAHTFLVATCVAAVALVTGKALFELWLRLWNWTARKFDIVEISVEEKISWRVGAITVLFGSWTHILLDAIMHRDVRPFFPISEANPFLGLLNPAQLHAFCIGTAIFGCLWLGLVWSKRVTD